VTVTHNVMTRFPLTDTTGFDTTTGDRTFSHAGSASAKGAVVVVFVSTTTQPVTGVLYGGVAMTLRASATDTVETGSVWVYELVDQAAFPTGTQTVTLQGCTADSKWATCSTVTCTDARSRDAGANSANTTTSTNPTMNVGTDDAAILYGGVHGGAAAPTSYAVGSGYTVMHNADYGAKSARGERSTTQVAGGTITYNFTFGTSDDWCLAAVAIVSTLPRRRSLRQVRSRLPVR
jgi:hypothetical protein